MNRTLNRKHYGLKLLEEEPAPPASVDPRTSVQVSWNVLNAMQEPAKGVEPLTPALRMRCSAN